MKYMGVSTVMCCSLSHPERTQFGLLGGLDSDKVQSRVLGLKCLFENGVHAVIVKGYI